MRERGGSGGRLNWGLFCEREKMGWNGGKKGMRFEFVEERIAKSLGFSFAGKEVEVVEERIAKSLGFFFRRKGG